MCVGADAAAADRRCGQLGPGVWAITEAGRQIGSADETMELSRRQQKEYQQGVQDTVAGAEHSDDEDEVTDEDSWQAALLGILRKIEPAAFERLCQRLLRDTASRGWR